jgi:hypothetical protein
MGNDQYEIQQPTSQFFAAQLITQEWAEPKDAEHRQHLASSDIKDPQGHVLVTAYALQRPDGQWSLMLINKDHDHAHQVQIQFNDTDGKRDRSFGWSVAMISTGRYHDKWHPDHTSRPKRRCP